MQFPRLGEKQSDTQALAACTRKGLCRHRTLGCRRHLASGSDLRAGHLPLPQREGRGWHACSVTAALRKSRTAEEPARETLPPKRCLGANAPPAPQRLTGGAPAAGRGGGGFTLTVCAAPAGASSTSSLTAPTRTHGLRGARLCPEAPMVRARGPEQHDHPAAHVSGHHRVSHRTWGGTGLSQPKATRT